MQSPLNSFRFPLGSWEHCARFTVTLAAGTAQLSHCGLSLPGGFVGCTLTCIRTYEGEALQSLKGMCSHSLLVNSLKERQQYFPRELETLEADFCSV